MEAALQAIRDAQAECSSLRIHHLQALSANKQDKAVVIEALAVRAEIDLAQLYVDFLAPHGGQPFIAAKRALAFARLQAGASPEAQPNPAAAPLAAPEDAQCTVYVLRNGDEYYVGHTSKPFAHRLEEHKAAKGSAWTARWKGKFTVERKHPVGTAELARSEEALETARHCLMHGLDCVRGSKYTKVYPTRAEAEAWCNSIADLLGLDFGEIKHSLIEASLTLQALDDQSAAASDAVKRARGVEPRPRCRDCEMQDDAPLCRACYSAWRAQGVDKCWECGLPKSPNPQKPFCLPCFKDTFREW